MDKKARCACAVLVLLTSFLTFLLPSPTSLLKGNSSMINVNLLKFPSASGGSICQFHEAPLISGVS